MPHDWFVRAHDSDEEKGPLTVSELKKLFADGQLPGECLVRRDDMDEPRRADSIRGLVPKPESAEPSTGEEESEVATRRPRRSSRLDKARGSGTFGSPGSLGMALVILLGLCAVLGGIAVYSGFGQNALLSDLAQGVEKTDAELIANDDFYAGVGLLQILMLVITAIVYLVWLYRVSANQRPLGVSRPKYSPGWAIGGWFVPFLNLVRPYQVVREIWDTGSDLASRSETSRRRHSSVPGTLVIFWWGSWIIDTGLSNIASRMMSGAEDLESMQTGTTAMMASDAVSMLSAILAALVVHRITSWQVLAHDAE
jgi:heme/copper-type cytochrome/quinol oxidase subunit 2